jgi:hypothetical protein
MKVFKIYEVNFIDSTNDNTSTLGDFLYSKFFEDIDTENIDRIVDEQGYSTYYVEFYFLGDPQLESKFFEPLVKLKKYLNTFNIYDEDIYINFYVDYGVKLVVEIADKKILKKLKKEAEVYHNSKKYNL